MTRDAIKVIRTLVETELAREQKRGGKPVKRPPLVTICRDYGSGAEEMGRLLAEKLGVSYYNREILDAVAEEADVDAYLLKRLDERVQGLKENWLYSLLPGVGDPHETYSRNLINVLLGIGVTGGVVVGRGAHLVLANYGAFRLHIVGSREVCARRVTERERCDLQSAMERVRAMGQQRYDFIQRLYKVDVNEPRQYDMVINSDGFTASQMLEIVLLAMKRIQPRPLQPAAQRRQRPALQ
jgi:cytidylate kinase